MPADNDDKVDRDDPDHSRQIAVAVEALTHAYNNSQNERSCHDQKTLRWARWTGIGVGIYTVLTLFIAGASICAALLAQQSLQLSRDNFVADQRPFIWLTSDFGAPVYRRVPDSSTGQIIWEWHFTNFGKTPANEVRLQHFMKLADGGFRPSYTVKDSEPLGAPLPPNGNQRYTVVSLPDETTPADYAKLVSTDFGIGISGKIDYVDLSGKSYQSAFCVTRLATGAIRIADPTENCENYIR